MWAPAVQLPAKYEPSTWLNACVPNEAVSEMMQQGTRARIHLTQSHSHSYSHSHSGWNLGKVPGDTSTVFCVDCNEDVRASRGTGTKKGHTTSHPTHVLTLMDSIKPGSPRHHLSRVAKTPLPVKQKVKTAYGQAAKKCCKEFGWGKPTVLQISQDPVKNDMVLKKMN